MTIANVYFFDKEGELWFHLDKPSTADTAAQPFVFEGPATERHKIEYEGALKAFLKASSEVEELVEKSSGLFGRKKKSSK